MQRNKKVWPVYRKKEKRNSLGKPRHWTYQTKTLYQFFKYVQKLKKKKKKRSKDLRENRRMKSHRILKTNKERNYLEKEPNKNYEAEKYNS